MIDPNVLQKAIELASLGQFQEADKIYSDLLEKEPENNLVKDAFRFSKLNQAKILTTSGKLAEAEIISVEYLKKYQNEPLMWMQLGLLKELIYSDNNQAYECYKIAFELGHKQALYNIAVSLYLQGKYKEAEVNYKKMLENFPNEKNTIYSLGMCYLKQKKFKEGYELFFQRDGAKYQFPHKLEDEITVICDQGYGDNIQFIRYLPFLKEKVTKIHVAASHALKSLFEKNYPQIEFITKDQINYNTQTIRMTDLAYILDIDFNHIPFSKGYLDIKTKDIKSDKPKIGLCWEAGSAGLRTMIARTINIRLFEEILSLDNIQIYSFQVQDSLKGNERYPQMINLAKDFKNFEDTASALKSMDLVITVDTSVAHLAGALGIKTFLLLPFVSDWRWFSDTKSTPWYKSVEIFKQNDPISWEKPLGEITCRLKEYSL